MARTFTGPKLQGQLGKFGATEITDITSFVHLGGGKVLSSTEHGNLLLWDGGFIKCEIQNKSQTTCHQGAINVILVNDSELITAGKDGYIRTWDLETIENAEVETDENAVGGAATVKLFEVDPLDELHLGDNIEIVGLSNCPRTSEFIVQDKKGNFIHLDAYQSTFEAVLQFPSGSTLSSLHGSAHSALALSKDGSLSLYDYLTRKSSQKIKFDEGGSFLTYLPEVFSLNTNVCRAWIP
jgi:WD40 repeat protein